MLRKRLEEWNILVTIPLEAPENLDELAQDWDTCSEGSGPERVEDNEESIETDSDGSYDGYESTENDLERTKDF